MTSAELTLPIATSIAESVTDLRGVAKLSPGRFGEVALLFPGERVHGIRRPRPQDDTHLELHIVVDVSAGVPLTELGDATRTTVRATWPAVRRVDVVFDDAV
ncbi:hypothetical protein FQN05_02555 [Corynebacterium aurimucosum]|uniref:Asp23/Gls24 family envelope stress response protein n=1 Tax=Corynebacterium aurimucosum TaxID=169292 RepID=A0A558IW51_9CORY|nr:hypothetical protein [Corynebacterium aurimucosum]TVU85598.1 hypothetical protein FQN05_02555 [Corynebacterium aurimucosum]